MSPTSYVTLSYKGVGHLTPYPIPTLLTQVHPWESKNPTPTLSLHRARITEPGCSLG